MSAGKATIASRVRDCKDCGNSMPIARTSCPHCGRPSLFPNVDLAGDTVEQVKLRRRFEAALADCHNRACGDVVNAFIDACRSSVAVFACDILKLHRQLGTGTEIFETYYDLEHLRLHASVFERFDWPRLRPQAEIELLGSHHNLDQLHYACLSIDGRGLESYGDCVVELAEPMIAHRASCFEGNTAVLYALDHDFTTRLRSVWADRHALCAAVFAAQINASTALNDFPAIIVNADPAERSRDRFIEVHVFGPMTKQTFGSIRIDTRKHGPQEEVLRQALTDKLTDVQITVVSL